MELRQGRPAAAAGRKLAVVACMDARLIPTKVLGLEEGDAHVIRNAGGVVTDDAIRSLSISQRLLGTAESVLGHHTDCGMLTFTDDEFRRSVQDGHRRKAVVGGRGVADLDDDVRQSIARIKAEPVQPAQERARLRLRRRDGGPARGQLTPRPARPARQSPTGRPIGRQVDARCCRRRVRVRADRVGRHDEAAACVLGHARRRHDERDRDREALSSPGPS